MGFHQSKNELPVKNNFISINQGRPTALSPEDERESVIAIFDNSVLGFLGKLWLKNDEGPDSPWRYAILAAHIADCGGGSVVQFAFDRFQLGSTVDPKTRQIIETHVHPEEFNAEGQPYMSGGLISAWRFLRDFSEDGWRSASEAKSVRDEIRPTLDREEALEGSGDAQRQQETQQRQQAAAQAALPHGGLAAEIAKGVALALRDLGVAPKKA